MKIFKSIPHILISLIVTSIFSLPLMANEKYDSAFLKESQYQALPELKADLEQDEVKTSIVIIPAMKCFVDTPEHDSFTFDQCGSQGAAFTTSAVFKIDYGTFGVASIHWLDSRCDNTSNTCILPITQNQTINLKAFVLINSNFHVVNAKAIYEGLY